MVTADELAGLPEDVRGALLECERALNFMFAGDSLDIIRAELLRQAREIADLRVSIVGLGAMRKDIEAEFAALKRRIAEAPTMRLTFGPAVLHALHDYDPNKLTAISNKRVALLPVGGETK